LYDLKEDPWEQVDLSGSPAHQEIKRNLAARLNAFMKATADPLLEGPVLSPHHSKTLAYLQNA